MRKVGIVVFGVTVAGLVVLSACVGDTPPAAVQGQLDAPCFIDGTCNPGLKCSTINGSSRCVIADAAVDDGSTTDAAVDAGPRVCKWTPTPFPCGGQEPPFACFGPTQSCSLTGCSGLTDIQWQCFSPNQCSSPCCVAAKDAELTATKDCSQGTLRMLAVDGGGGVNGAVCNQGAQCPAGDTQLCQSNSQCPKGQICSPVKVTSGGLSSNGLTFGACVPE